LSKNNATINRLLLTGGIAGPLLFILVILIEGAARPGYDAWTQAASVLSLSNQGWMQIANFIVCGLLILGCAVEVRQILRDGPGRTWGPILLAVVGAGLIIAGIFVTDPAQGYPPGTPPGPSLHTTLHGAIHFFIGGLAFFSGLPASCFVFARRFAGDIQWKGWSLYSIISGIMMIAFFVAFAIASTHAGPGGLFERVSIAIGMIWMALFALKLLRLPPPSVSPVHSAKEVV
jgi:hypothetical membrane protein